MQEGEVIAIPVSATEVDILVSLRACSLTDSLENYLIEVSPVAINCSALSTTIVYHSLGGVRLCHARWHFEAHGTETFLTGDFD